MIEVILNLLLVTAIATLVSYLVTRYMLKRFNIDELNNAMIDTHRVLSHLKKQYKKNSKKLEPKTRSVMIDGKKRKVEIYENPNYNPDQANINPEVQ